jgi:hypothetical protein
MNQLAENWIMFANAQAKEKYVTSPEIETLTSSLTEQELIIEDHLKRCAMIAQQLKRIPRLQVNRQKVSMLRAMRRELRAAIVQHAALRSKIADDICRAYVAQQRRTRRQEGFEVLPWLAGQIVLLMKLIARVDKQERFHRLRKAERHSR